MDKAGEDGSAKKRKFEGHTQGHHKRSRDFSATAAHRLTEVDVGVTEYVSDYPGFSGIIKQRFSDFLVNEIDPEGKEVHLTDVSPSAADEAPSKDINYATTDDFTDEISKEDWEALKNLADTKQGIVEIDVTTKSKEDRKNIHEAIKKIYKTEFTANTKEVDGRKIISVIFQTDNRRNYIPKENRFVHFTMYKENMDTMDAVNLLAQKLRVRTNLVTYAGTKDKRAKTCQRVCIRNMKPAHIFNVSKSIRGVTMGNFKYSKHALKLGSLSGNRFQIVLRNVSGSDEEIELSMISLKEKGFLNYFGLQRFGTQTVPTYSIGKALIVGDWQEAVNLILKPREGDYPNLMNARRVWNEKKDAAEAFKQLRGRMSAEGHLLKGLMNNHKNDLVNALEGIPRNTRLLYLHSYQSYIWNQVLSKRIKEFGFKPVIGDLVLAEDAKLEDIPETEGEVEEPMEISEGSDAAPGSNPTANEPSKLPRVMALTAENIDKYSIHDVLLPLPGFNVKYPENACMEWYKEIFAKDGLTLESLKQKEKKYSLGGAYRKISILPSSLNWKIAHYDDATQPLVLSDMDVIQKTELGQKEGGKMKALVLDFILPSSVYATMALREVLKVDTGSFHQTSLNPKTPVESATPEVVPGEVEVAAE